VAKLILWANELTDKVKKNTVAHEKRIVDFNNFISKVLRRKQLAEGKKDQPIIGSRH